MNAERLLAHYKQIADAPDAIARLRRFILNLAVRGKLVPQDAGDEPAPELLKQIAKEKARLVKAGDLRKPRDLDNGGESDKKNWRQLTATTLHSMWARDGFGRKRTTFS